MRAPHAVRASPSATVRLAALGVLLLVACARREGCTGDYCGTLVIATAGEPESLLPPVLTAGRGQALGAPIFLKPGGLRPPPHPLRGQCFPPPPAQAVGGRGFSTAVVLF